MSRGVDVLAVLAGTIEGYEAAIPSLRGKRRDECEDGLADLKEVRAAVAELIEALVNHHEVCGREICHPDEWRKASERLRNALARVRGAA